MTNNLKKEVGGLKIRLLTKLRNATLLVIGVTAFVTLFNNSAYSQTSNKEEENYVQRIADLRFSREFQRMPMEKQWTTLADSVFVLSQKIHDQIHEYITGRRFIEAESQIKFLETIAIHAQDEDLIIAIKEFRKDMISQAYIMTMDQIKKGNTIDASSCLGTLKLMMGDIQDTEIKQLCNELINRLEKSLKESKLVLKNEISNILDKVQPNRIGYGSLQKIENQDYGTFTEISKDQQMAIDKAKIGLAKVLKISQLPNNSNILNKIQTTSGGYIVTIAMRLQ